LVLYWKGRHDEAQMKLEQSRSMNEQLQDKINSKENQHRQELLHHHTVAQERMESELDEYRQRQAQLQSQLEAAQQEAANNAAAAEDYRIARDQLEDVGRLHKELNDTNAALNRYKRRVEELQDVQQQLKCEKEAHERDVQEICRLESRVANLEPFRRQVEEYKNRIAQAEFRLTEANEQLQRQHQDNNSTAVDVKGLLKQNTKLKAQCEELGRRLQQNEIASRDSFVSGTVERLTPELHGELERLRSENAQLRHFYDQRQGDAVTGLQQHLDDAQRLGEVYKSHYSTTRTKLTQNEAAMAQVQAELAETQQCLRTTTEELTIRTETAEKTAASLQAELHERSKKLELVCTQLQAEKDRARILELKVDDYQSQLTDTEKLASERLAYWKKAQKEVDDTSSELDAVTKQCKMLLGDLEDQKLRNKELEDLQSRLGKDLQSAQEELEDAHMQNAAHERRIRELESSVSKITESKLKLQEELEREQRAHQESRDESHRSLQATRSVLLSQNKKQVDEIQDNMNRLLEDERRANRRKDEDHKREVTELNTKWKKDYDDMKERFTLNLQQSHHEAVERVESLKKEYQLMLDKREAEHSRDLRRVELEAHDLIEKTKQDAEDERSSLITRGKSMIEETKVKAESERHLMEQDVAELEHRLKNAELERDNIEMLLRSKINNIKDKLNDTSQQNLDLITENEDLSERVKSLEKENRELEEFKDRFIRNRSAGGLDGGQFRVQMERLQREYHAVLEENRNLKKGKKLESVDETDDSLSFYGRGRSTISILRSEYEAQIETLNDEKRSLVMKNAAASTDVQRAEQRAWEREQEVTRLKNEVTSLKLELARLEDKRESWEGTSPEQDNNYSPLLRFDGMDMPRLGSSSSTTTSRLGMGSFDDIDMPRPRSRSPSLTRAMKNRAEHEKVLQSRITSLTGTPPRVPSRPVGLNTSSELGRRTSSEANPSTSSSGLQPGSADKVLSPTHRHDNVFNTRQSQSDLSSHRNDRSFLRGNVQLSQSVTYPFDKQPSMLDTDLSTTTYRTTKKAE
jgi:chromosome segregation ATPase